MVNEELNNNISNNNEIKYKLLLEDIPIGVFKIRIDGSIKEANLEFLNLVGANSIEFLKKINFNINDYIILSDNKLNIFDYLQKQSVANINCKLKNLNNELLDNILIRAKLIYDKNTYKPKSIIGFVNNLSELNKYLNELEDTKNIYEIIVKNSNYGIIVSDEKGNVSVYNNKFKEIFDLTENDIDGKFVWEIQHNVANKFNINKVPIEITKSLIESFLYKKEDFKFPLINKVEFYINNQKVILYETLVRIETSKGHRLCFFFNDLTDLKLKEEQLTEEIKQKTAILKILPEDIFILNNSSNLFSINVSSKTSISKAFLKDLINNNNISFELYTKFQTQLKNNKRNKDSASNEYLYKFNNKNYYFLIKSVSIDDNSILIVVNDITDLKINEIALREINSILIEKNKMENLVSSYSSLFNTASSEKEIVNYLNDFFGHMHIKYYGIWEKRSDWLVLNLEYTNISQWFKKIIKKLIRQSSWDISSVINVPLFENNPFALSYNNIKLIKINNINEHIKFLKIGSHELKNYPRKVIKIIKKLLSKFNDNVFNYYPLLGFGLVFYSVKKTNNNLFKNDDSITFVIEQASNAINRIKIHNQLEESHQKHKLLINNIPDITYITDEFGFLTFISENCEKILGFTPKELINATYDNLYNRINQNHLANIKKKYRLLIDKGKLYNVEYEYQKKDGEWIWINDRSINTYKQNDMHYSFGIMTDITEKKLIEDSMIKYNEELKRKNEDLKEKTGQLILLNNLLEKNEKELKSLNASKDKFFSIIAHDLKSPFMGFLGLTNTLKNDINHLEKNEIIELANMLHQSADKVYKLLENLLEWTRIQRGAISYNPEMLNLKQVAEISIDVLTVSARNKSITLINNINPDINVFADLKMLDTVIRNLLSNSIKFSFLNSKIEINCYNFNDNYYRIAIKDFGVGMSKEAISKLFKIDSNFTTKGTNSEEGTGLGTILCKELVEKNKGIIWVESEPNKGAEFSFTIPKNKL